MMKTETKTYTYDVQRGDAIRTPEGIAFVETAFPTEGGFYFGTDIGAFVVPEDSMVTVVTEED